MPRRMQNGVISRLKVMAELDIAERRVPQDGRIGLVVGGKPIDMRVATLPTVYGEKIVMRLLDKSNVMLDLARLGVRAQGAQALPALDSPGRTAAHPRHRPDGLRQVDHPLRDPQPVINSPEKNVITVEDPVEYRLPGINQVQVEPQGRA